GSGPAVTAARRRAPHTVTIEVEVENLEQLEEALTAGADLIMLDNMDPATMREAVRRARLRTMTGRPVRLEASGGVRAENIVAIAETGVDLISVGYLTHSAPSLDFSLELDLGRNK
ncbi:MAG: nicotinate-nucleotide diphosphorylase (carboxylating), partial [Firmicutes bacterium]|nr:nicotinate-nucleotide diphosphorylase (carboxylating) [Bacillota bacterium]